MLAKGATVAFDLQFGVSIVPTILSGLGTTLWIALASCVGSALLGFSLEALRRKRTGNTHWHGRVSGRCLLVGNRSRPVVWQ